MPNLSIYFFIYRFCTYGFVGLPLLFFLNMLQKSESCIWHQGCNLGSVRNLSSALHITEHLLCISIPSHPWAFTLYQHSFISSGDLLPIGILYCCEESLIYLLNKENLKMILYTTCCPYSKKKIWLLNLFFNSVYTFSSQINLVSLLF